MPVILRENYGEIGKALVNLFLTFFEPYLNGILGSVTKYYIFILVLVLLSGSALKFKPYQLFYIGWLLYKICSLLWSGNTYIASVHFVSQVGMIMLFYALTNVEFSGSDLDKVTKTLWLSSALIGVLSIFFSHPYHGIVATRQVLYLFNQEADPNNQAAFLIVGIVISLYQILIKKELKLLSLVILAINCYTMLITGSRGGLVTLGVVAIFSIFSNGNRKSWKNTLYKLLLAGVIAAVLYLLIKKYLPIEIYERLFGFESYGGGSERDVIWKNALELFGKGINPLMGAGWGAYYGYNGMNVVVHNTYLAMLCDVGTFGVLLFFYPLIKAILYLARKKELLPIYLLIGGLVPSFFIEAINKRFFWSVIQIAFITLNYLKNREKTEKLVYEENINN